MKNQDLIQFLNRLLSNSFVMYVKCHRYHWFVKGRHFFTLHELFEEMYHMFGEEIDVIAERILMIGGKPLATMSKYLEESTLVEASADDEEDEIIAQLKQDYEQLTHDIQKDGLPLAEAVHDEPTIDMLISIQGKLEKYMWMLSAYREYQ